MTPRDSLWKHLSVAFALALGLYVVGFAWLEHRRHRLGPWDVTFIQAGQMSPRVVINQPALEIRDVQIEFATPATPTASTNVQIRFAGARPVPFPVPFGECVFLDPLFLPGTVTLELFGHRVQMLPRTLSIDGQEHGWQPGMRLRVEAEKAP
jgi:hypothetical protein